jgi:hypothetical protein
MAINAKMFIEIFPLETNMLPNDVSQIPRLCIVQTYAWNGLGSRGYDRESYIKRRWTHDLGRGFSPGENGEINKPFLCSLRNRLSNTLKFTAIDRSGAPLCVTSFLQTCKQNMPNGPTSARPLSGHQRPQS